MRYSAWFVGMETGLFLWSLVGNIGWLAIDTNESLGILKIIDDCDVICHEIHAKAFGIYFTKYILDITRIS